MDEKFTKQMEEILLGWPAIIVGNPIPDCSVDQMIPPLEFETEGGLTCLVVFDDEDDAKRFVTARDLRTRSLLRFPERDAPNRILEGMSDDACSTEAC